MPSPSGELRQTRFLSRLPQQHRDAIEGMAIEKRVLKKAEIFHKGAPPTALYLVLDGRARVTTPSVDGREYVIRDLLPGDLFGEIGIFGGADRTASVVAAEDSRIGVVSANDFKQYLRRQPDVALTLLQCFAERLRLTTESLEDNVFLTIEQRLAKSLLQLAASCGVEDAAGVLLEEPVSQSLLGQITGTSREEVNRRLRTWVEKGLVQREGDRMRLLDLELLEKIASGRT